MSSGSSPGEGYEKALGLLQQLQNTIESQQRDIARLHSRVKSLRGQNEELRKEREELRESLAEKVNKIAELSRKNAMQGHSLPFLQKSYSTGTQELRLSSGDYAEPIELPIVTVEDTTSTSPGGEDPFDGNVTLRRQRSRGDSESRRGVYMPSTPPIVPKKSRREQKREEEEEEKQQDEESEEEEEELSLTPVPQHLIDSERFSSDMNTDLSSNEGSITSMEDCRSPASSVTASPTHDSINFIFGLPVSEEEEQADGGRHPHTASMPPMRSRLATVAHIARNKGTKDKDTPEKATPLRRQNSFPRRGKSTTKEEDSFQLSPDMELKIQQLIQEGLGKKYGGLDRANWAAIVIQRAYRKQKLNIHFKMLRRMQRDQVGGAIRERRRTMSVRHRATSIMRKNKLVTSTAKMNQVKENVTGLSPSISRRELRKKPSPPTLALGDIKVEEGEEEEVGDVAETPPSIFEGISISSLRDMFPPGPPRQLSQSALERKKNIGTNIFNRKPMKGIQYLVYHNVLKDDPSDVASFLKDHYGLSKEKIGEFVGEIRYEFNMLVLECLVQLIDLSNKSIDEALRSFQLLFRMPGEAQKIDKVMQVFAGEYYHSNKDDGIIKSEDAAYVLSFAIMMLHTDLHNPSIKRHMTKKDWLNMNRGTNDKENFPNDFLLQIYDRIQQREFSTGRDHTHEVTEIRKQIIGSGCPPLINPQRRFLKSFPIQQVNDMHKRAIRRHRRTMLLFNDVLLVVKTVATNKYEFRKSFTLLNSQAIEFYTNNYKFGVCIQQELKGETYCCNCESEESRKELLTIVGDAIFELKEMEKERIVDFKGGHKQGEKSKNELPGSELLASKSLSSSADNLHALSQKEKVDFRRVATKNAVRDSIKRSSKDSGFDSPHTISPSPNGTEVGGATGGAIQSISSLTSPKKERIRSRTPEPRRTMKVYPEPSSNGAAGAKSFLTLSPSHSSKSQHDKIKERKSMPPDAMSQLQAATNLSPNHQQQVNHRLSLSPSFSTSQPKKKTQRTLSNRS